MIRSGLIGLLLVAVLAAVGLLWWTDPSDRALEQIEAGLRQEEPDRRPVDAVVERELLDETPEAERVQIPTSTETEAMPTEEPVSRVTGVVIGDTDVFPTADRSGVTVYCWPGWFGLAPAKVDSLDQLKGLQVTTTDARGRFRATALLGRPYTVWAVADDGELYQLEVGKQADALAGRAKQIADLLDVPFEVHGSLHVHET